LHINKKITKYAQFSIKINNYRMKENELTTELSVRLNWKKQEVDSMLEALGEVIGDKLSQDDIISLQDFGQFESRKKAERISVVNGKRYLIPPKLVPVFKPSPSVRSYIKSLDDNEQ
jgi:Bacterial nucleoid DNA-binding protein